MPRQEDHPGAAEASDQIVVRRRAERRLDADALHVGEPLHLVEATAADDTDDGAALAVHAPPVARTQKRGQCGVLG